MGRAKSSGGFTLTEERKVLALSGIGGGNCIATKHTYEVPTVAMTATGPYKRRFSTPVSTSRHSQNHRMLYDVNEDRYD